ncbi:FtsW/RodA/SpoVE family cell cycle protein [Pseudactinotalea suaedae]|uniref:FtsW/RodA/SpoVE family cell cycle protein n=1 Tax=Pseudactinotalea suaedae TaxID=1524924 RepID=UPI0012E24190|nr:FtsW/RodA/SpoVE family cell cycle protein [Pseudactinotalea suaedae]
MTAVGVGARRRTGATSTSRSTATRRRKQTETSRFAEWRTAAWASPTTSYYLIGGAGLLLLLLGLVMVLSASMVDSLNKSGGATPFTDFLDQLTFAAIGVPLALVASRFKPEWFRKLAWLILAGALGMQALLFIPSLAVRVGGNTNWVSLPGIGTFQPSEFAKLGLAIWLGAVLATKGDLLRQWRHALVPGVLVAGAFLGLVLYGHDLGTALILMALVAGALWVAGVPASLFVLLSSFAAAAAGFLVFSSRNRRERIMQFLGLGQDSHAVDSFQPDRALEALGSGGLSGVGLGASRIKWRGLPAAQDDYIFAIIGEELGLLGTLLVILLFVALAIGITRVVKRHPDRFVKITAAALGAWIVGQAFVNIGVVIGVLPVIGVPLPLLSAGGSSLITTLAALGILLAFARSEPGAREAFAARRGSVRRSLAVLAPQLRRSRARG